MSNNDQEPTGARKQPEQTGTKPEENSELMSFGDQPQKRSLEESELLRNAMNPLESRTARPTDNSDEIKIPIDESNPSSGSKVPPAEDGFINIEAED